jgi:hypothetical protein
MELLGTTDDGMGARRGAHTATACLMGAARQPNALPALSLLPSNAAMAAELVSNH